MAVLIWENNKFKVCQRPAHKARGFLWEFSSLTDRTIAIIEEKRVLTLYPNGGELFGCRWNRK